MNLVIVESPTKARKLTGYLSKDFKVEASVGHVRDLPKKKLGVDVENNFTPTYEVSEDKKKVISQIQKLAKTADKIYLAMDPDREGEAIAWHIKHLINEKYPGKDFKRATFHEITKSAVMDAIDHPSKLRMDLVDAQQARRVLDRLVGYQLSPVLWKKIRRGLSAGRVQSVALRLIVEREREIQAFKPDEYWEVDVLLSLDQKQQKVKIKTDKDDKKVGWEEIPENMLPARVMQLGKKKYEPKSEADVKEVVNNLGKSDFSVESIERKERNRASLPPFTTSTLQQTAATRLGLTSKNTMRLAQQLYEEGLITYHRTDSVNLSTQAINNAREYIQSEFGDKYLPGAARLFKGKSKNAQEAHEAIRVTDLKIDKNNLISVSGKFTQQHAKLYDLIWRRFVASQMESATYDGTTIMIQAQKGDFSALCKSTGSILKFDGWMRLFPGGDDTLLPDVSEKQPLFYQDIAPMQKFTQPPARYNDASLIKELEKRGIGRPSTYASIISVIEDRGYVSRDQKRFVASPVGMTVSDFLLEHFDTIMDYDFTAEMEEDLDRIARGEKEWKKVIGSFYSPFEKKIEKVSDKAERVQIPVEKTGEKCPDCEKLVETGELKKSEAGEIVIRSGRFGKFKSCSRFPDCKFTENIVETLADQKCPVCGEGDIVVKNTRWGKPFFGCGNYPQCDWASWAKPEPGLKLTKKQWEEMKKQREERKAKRAATMAKKGKGKKKSKKMKK